MGALTVTNDIAYLDIEVPAGSLTLAEPPGDPERLKSCAAAISSQLAQATSPAILVDQDGARYAFTAWLEVAPAGGQVAAGRP
jgi:indolepyruvate decarboxylase